MGKEIAELILNPSALKIITYLLLGSFVWLFFLTRHIYKEIPTKGYLKKNFVSKESHNNDISKLKEDLNSDISEIEKSFEETIDRLRNHIDEKFENLNRIILKMALDK